MRRTLGGILIGGSGTRMGGTPKQMLAFRGRTFLERVADALEVHTREVVLIGAGPVPAECARLRRLPDAPGVSGPMAGLLAALRSDEDAAWILAGCDQPLLSPAAVSWLLAREASGVVAVLPRRSQDSPSEPFPGLYLPGALAEAEAVVLSGRRAPSALATRNGARCPIIPDELAGAWRDVDTREELRALEEGGAP